MGRLRQIVLICWGGESAMHHNSGRITSPSGLFPREEKTVAFISVPRLLIVLGLIVFASIWKSTHFVAVLAIPTAYAQTVAPTCPQGYTFSGSNCVKSAPAPSCPSGYILSSGQCISVVQSSPSGPSAGPWVLIVQKALGVRSARELDGATICTIAGTPSVAAITTYFQNNRMTYTPLAASSGSDARDKYLKNACDVLIADDRSSAPALRSLTPAGAHIILPERLVAVGAAPTARPSLPLPATPVQPVNLAYPLQSELKRIGCLRGGVDGVWGNGSRAALGRFAQRAGLNLGSQPSQNALDEARRRNAGFCRPVRVAPKRAKPKGCRSGTVFLEGQCIPKSEVASYCGPGFTRSGSKCVSMAGQEEQLDRCNSKDYAFCKPRAREYCEGDGSNSCINSETRTCLREEIGCKP